MTFFQEVMTFRRRAAEFVGAWYAVDVMIYSEFGEQVGRMKTPRTAEFVVTTHNSWLRLANAWLMTLRAMRDRRLISNAEGKK